MFYFALSHVHLQCGPSQVSSRYCGVHCLVVRISCRGRVVQVASQVWAQCPLEVCPPQHTQHAGRAEAGADPATVSSNAADNKILSIVASL
jgi:hypothetical protein